MENKMDEIFAQIESISNEDIAAMNERFLEIVKYPTKSDDDFEIIFPAKSKEKGWNKRGVLSGRKGGKWVINQRFLLS